MKHQTPGGGAISDIPKAPSEESLADLLIRHGIDREIIEILLLSLGDEPG
jgi:hypothetical protein